MQYLKKNILILTIATYMAGLNACVDNNDDKSSEGTVSIGIVADLSGDFADYGNAAVNAAQIAIDETNKNGGLYGKTLKLEIRDSQANINTSVEAATELADIGVLAIIGELQSTNTIEIANQITSSRGLLQCSGSSTATEITDLADNDALFRTIISDAYQGAVIADLVIEAGHTNVAIVYNDGAYGTSLKNVFSSNFISGGGTVSMELPHDKYLVDFQSQVDQLAATEATAVAFFSFSDVGESLIQAMKGNNIVSKMEIFLSDSMIDEDLPESIGIELMSQMIGTKGGTFNSPEKAAYDTMYQERYGSEPHIYGSEFFDCTMAVILALSKAGEGAAFKTQVSSLYEIANEPGQITGISNIATAFEYAATGQDIDWTGPSNVEFDENGDQSKGLILVYQYDEAGNLEIIDTREVGL